MVTFWEDWKDGEVRMEGETQAMACVEAILISRPHNLVGAELMLG